MNTKIILTAKQNNLMSNYKKELNSIGYTTSINNYYRISFICSRLGVAGVPVPKE